jgi:hypothetical protein
VNIETAISNVPAVARPVGNRFWWPLSVGLIAAILCVPFFRMVWLGDEGILLHGADQMLQGRTPYVDFFEVLPPGGFLLTAAWLGVFGTSIVSVRSLAILTITGIAVFTYLACRQASKSRAASALPALGWVAMSQGLWTEVNHHWFTTLFSMAAAWATLAGFQHSRRLREPIIAGVTAGAAMMLIPPRGALAVLAAATAFVGFAKDRARAAAYLVAAACVPLCLVAYLIWRQALEEAIRDAILFAATRYAAIQSVPFSAYAAGQNLPLRYFFPLTVLLTLITYASDWHASRRDGMLRTCAAFGLAGLVGCFPRPDIAHIAFSAPLACPLFVFCLRRLTVSWRSKYRFAAAAMLIGLCLPAVFSYGSAAAAALRTPLAPTPRGNVAFGQGAARTLVARISRTPPKDAYFFYPYMPMLPFLTARPQVSRFDILLPEYTTPSQYAEACVSVMRDATWVVIDRDLIDLDILRIVFPAMPTTKPQETVRFEQALKNGFAFAARDGPFELRRRIAAASQSRCSSLSR